MAIESIYWREEISRIAKTLKPKRRPLNWSERLVCTTEREIIVGFFILRKLVELKKVTDKTKNLMLEIQGCKPKTNVHFSNRFELEEYYDLNGENSYQRSAWYLSNQFIHSYTSLLARDQSRNWSEVFIFSDYDRNKFVWRVPISEIIRAFETCNEDWPHEIHMKYNDGKSDWDVKVN